MLKEYLAEEEAATIMFTLLDEQKAKKFWEEELLQEGRAEGEKRFGALMSRLIASNRLDDAKVVRKTRVTVKSCTRNFN